MIARREYVLDTIQSLQSHFLQLYSHGERQCRLGYDTSLQCDSFQLGEMVRFFVKLNTLSLQGSIFNIDGSSQYQGDIGRLLESLRQCPEYQIDANHRHCGLRERLMPLLDLVQSFVSMIASPNDVGICGDCWQDHRSEYAWGVVKRPVTWSAHLMEPTSRLDRPISHQNSCLKRHLALRDMFTAVSREWTGARPSQK
jgi:hypothetical protein